MLMHYLPYPRHRYRVLFFPPGLLALAGLLWLGCVAVVKISSPKPQQTVLEIALPPLRPDSTIKNNFYPVYASTQEIERFRPWYTATLIGNVLSDYFALQRINIIAKHIWDDSNHSRGLRIQFAQTATFTNLVQLVDCLNQMHAKRFWIDLQHEPVTLYTFTIFPAPARIILPPKDEARQIICGNVSSFPPVPTRPEVAPVELPAIFSPTWRNTTLLLLLLAGLSIRQLMRLRAAYH